MLAAWAASPARFREDANAEEDLALGAYRDRVVVELAQNAADAAARTGVPGRLLLRLSSDRLVAANTGVPLDAAAVEALSTLRASAKRDEPAAVGRFGVGFAAVRAVADEVALLSRTGGVRWSVRDVRAEVARVPVLAEELQRRGGQVPALRLPFPAAGEVPEGYDSAVTLVLRAEAVDEVGRQLAEVDDALLLALPGLDEVQVETGGVRRSLHASRRPGSVEVVDRDPDGSALTRWRLSEASGRLDPALLADRPVEERARTTWSVSWAVPVDEAGAPLPPRTAAVVHAPTPSAEPLGLPALLLATFPLDATRRLVAAGPLRDFLVDRAAAGYAGLVRFLAEDGAGVGLLDLVPAPVPVGELDGRLRAAAVEALGDTPFLPAAGGGGRLRARDAVLVEGLVGPGRPGDGSVLAEVVPGLVDLAWARRWPALTRLGARRLPLADVVDALAGLADRSPREWRRLYDALERAEPDALGALPVPLADGRLVRGPRGLLLPGPDLPPAVLPALAALAELSALSTLSVPALRMVHPDAVSPLLERLGARPATPVALLDAPAVRAAVAGSLDLTDAEEAEEAADADVVAEAVLALVAAAGEGADLPPGLGELALPDAEGGYAPAAELVLPGSELDGLLQPDTLIPVAADLVERWGADVLVRVGVLRTFTVVRDLDVPADEDIASDTLTALDGLDDYLEHVVDVFPGEGAAGLPPVLTEVLAVRDLDLVRDDAWPRALALLARPPLREAVVEPAVAVVDGRSARVPSYSAWWLRQAPLFAGRAPRELRDPTADPLLAGLYDDAPALGLDAAFLGALGLRTTLARLLAEPGGADELLDRLAEPARAVVPAQLRAVYLALAAVDPAEVSLPARVRVRDGAGTRVVRAKEACVLDTPQQRHLGHTAPLVVPRAAARPLAEVLDLPLASEVAPARVRTRGSEAAVPAAVHEVLPAAPARWLQHDRLVVGWTDRGTGSTPGREVEVDWWVEDGRAHAATLDGLARALAEAAGAWERRLLVAAVLAEPDRVEELLAEADLDAE